MRRAAAAVLDALPLLVAWGMWEGAAIRSAVTDCVTYAHGGVSCTAVNAPQSGALAALTFAFSVGYLGWNFGYRQGRTGASLGKSVTRIRVVAENTWRPIGSGASLLRHLVHVVDAAICGIGFLFPLWDAKRQTLADKLMGTVCVPVDRRGRAPG
ncbi:RDD family protein [Mycolicibacterium parafortuitum]|uniref:RDD family protein n=1 Tax=Mycolicibacterium parafortuitum TaxID=39692 RepID=UPI00235666DE|nr:RDD family protein [Mycolicibacterium parafortuitum]